MNISSDEYIEYYNDDGDDEQDDELETMVRQQAKVIPVMYVLIVVSLVCVMASLAAWWLMPRWRSLHNFVSINQIGTGTLWNCCNCFIYFTELSEWIEIFDLQEPSAAAEYLYIAEHVWKFARLSLTCWSLFATAYAYLRLVIMYIITISSEKIIAFVTTYGMATLIYIIFMSVVDTKETYIDYFVTYHMILLLSALIWLLFIRICLSVMSCCARAMSNRNMTHVMALVGVAIMCDTFDIIYIIMFLYAETDWASIFMNEHVIVETIFTTFKVVLQTLFILFRKSSRNHWKFYLNRIGNRFSNMIELNRL